MGGGERATKRHSIDQALDHLIAFVNDTLEMRLSALS
jgi:hypothetical protein